MRWVTAGVIALLSLGATGCGSSDDDTGHGEQNTELPPPDVGIQLVTSEYTLEPGTEEYTCWSFAAPADTDIEITELQQQIPVNGVHHFGIFTNIVQHDGSTDPYECFAMGATWGLVSGGGVGTPPVKFPEGTSMNLPAGKHIIFQLHLLNATSDPIVVPPVRVNLVGAANPQTLAPVGLLIAGTLEIEIPPKSTDVQVSGGCTLEEPLENIFAAFPHMHQLGRRIRTEIIPATGSGTAITDEVWDFGDQGLYPASSSAKVGDRIETTCHFDNPTPNEVKFGLKSSQEMCVEVLYHYPAKSASKYCGIY